MSAREVRLPLVSDDGAPFWAGTLVGELRVQRCRDTGRLIWPPRPRSPHGRRRAPEWVAVSGRGRVWSFVVPHAPLTPPFDAVAPFNVVVVALDDDPTVRMVGNLVTGPDAPLDGIDPHTIEIGEPVRVVFDSPAGEGVRFPRWVRT